MATPGLEDIVAAELTALGMEITERDPGGVGFTGRPLDAMTVNFLSRTTERVWARATDFRARSFSELFQKTRRLNWSRVLQPGGPIEVVAASHGSRLTHTTRIGDAIVKALGATTTAGDVPVQKLLARIVDDRCTLSVDMSGDRLHMRGYRTDGASAPLRETRAAGLLHWAGWTPGTPLYDPCCGSGTFLIEAALAAAGVAPGTHRSFAFEHWPKYDVAGFRKLKTEAAGEPVPTPISGSDAAALAVKATQENAARAGTPIEVAEATFENVQLPESAGLLIANPPYGKRVRADLGDTWRQLGALYARAPAWNRVILSPNKRLYDAFQAGFGGAEPTARLEFHHGGLRIQALRWGPS